MHWVLLKCAPPFREGLGSLYFYVIFIVYKSDIKNKISSLPEYIINGFHHTARFYTFTINPNPLELPPWFGLRRLHPRISYLLSGCKGEVTHMLLFNKHIDYTLLA